MPTVDVGTGTIANDEIRLTPSTVKPGILDLCWRPDGKDWDVYNNIVVVARRDGIWGNAEIQQQAPRIANVVELAGGAILRATYEYASFSNEDNVLKERCNHAALNLAVEIGSSSAIRTQLFSRNYLEAAAVNNYWGFRWRVDKLSIGETHDAADQTWTEGIEDGYYRQGKWTRLSYDGSTISFWGKGGPLQWQCAPPDRATVVIETRRCPWDPSQGEASQAPWFETVSIERAPFRQGDETWFGFTRIPFETAAATART